MANIDWEIVGHITPEGDMRIGGFSLGGDQLFDEPLMLAKMIESLCESVEISPDHRFSKDGVDQITALAATLARAWEDVHKRLKQNEALDVKAFDGSVMPPTGALENRIVSIGKFKPK